MNAIVERPRQESIFIEYLYYINQAKNRDQLEFIIKDLHNHPEYYLMNYGFGGSHFWVGCRQTGNRLIFVPFENN
jgi:hypothetical protein